MGTISILFMSSLIIEAVLAEILYKGKKKPGI